jgi:D-cysteine desulfhydrase
MSGNKVRKLQFLLADALAKQCDSIVTIGGEQSNHVRATAMAARAVGLEPHIILRTDKERQDLGLSGNILLDRLAGAQIWLATKREWRNHGSDALVNAIVEDLRQEGKNPYPIPVGGTNGLGTWGYLDAVAELETQIAEGNSGLPSFSDIAITTGSGGTTGGLALGVHLSSLESKVHGFSVCDNPGFTFPTYIMI